MRFERVSGAWVSATWRQRGAAAQTIGAQAHFQVTEAKRRRKSKPRYFSHTQWESLSMNGSTARPRRTIRDPQRQPWVWERRGVARHGGDGGGGGWLAGWTPRPRFAPGGLLQVPPTQLNQTGTQNNKIRRTISDTQYSKNETPDSGSVISVLGMKLKRE